AALRVLVEEGMIENAAVQGARFLDGLRSIRSNRIREVRGRGLMLAVELHPEAGDERRYCKALQARGVLAKEDQHHIVRGAELAYLREIARLLACSSTKKAAQSA